MECKDDRDRIYAMLGISVDTEDLKIVPNYAQSQRDTFINASVAMYLHSSEGLYLFILLSSRDNLSDSSLPSWHIDLQQYEQRVDSFATFYRFHVGTDL